MTSQDRCPACKKTLNLMGACVSCENGPKPKREWEIHTVEKWCPGCENTFEGSTFQKPEKTDEVVVGWCGPCIDIEERKRADQMRRDDALKQQRGGERATSEAPALELPTFPPD